MRSHKLYEGYRPSWEEVADILDGAFAFGDDGENAIIIASEEKGDDIIITVRQDDGVVFDANLSTYIDAVDLEGDELSFVKEYLAMLKEDSLEESVKPARRKLVLNEARGATAGLRLVLTGDDSFDIRNFIVWCREILTAAKLPVPEIENVYVDGDNAYYLIDYISLRASQERAIMTKLQKYSTNSNFSTGLHLDKESSYARFAMPFKPTGKIEFKSAAINAAK